MTRWAEDAALRLEQAATELFEAQGYTATTVPQITARAGLTTRTFFRHFSDKREVLFLRDRELPDVVRAALADLPLSLAPAAVAEQGLLTATRPLEQWRSAIGRRRAILRAEDQLRERELMKSARLADAIADGLTARTIPADDARVLAGFSAMIFDIALDRWLDARDDATLFTHVELTWSRTRVLLGGSVPDGT